MTNSLTLQVSRRFGSLQLSGLMLIALLQRTPVLRLLAAAESVWVSSSLGQVLKASAVVASMLGAVDTLAGATTLVTTPASPAEATVGVQLSPGFAFAYTGGATTVGSYFISGLPPGLSVPNSTSSGNGRALNGSSGTITGTPTQAGDFTVSITAFDDANLGAGTHGSVLSFYTITVVAGSTSTAPEITTQPTSQTVTVGQPVSFSVTATGDPTPTFQWRKGGVNIAGATNATFTIASTTANDAAIYTVVVTNSVSSVTSNGATLTVNAAATAPSISTHPVSLSVTTGQQASFSVEATGTAPLTYQWRKGGVNINGATGATFTIPCGTDVDAGTYTVVVTNSVNSATSNGATLTVNAATAAPTITTQPLGQTANAGANVTFIAAASGNPTPTFQWRKNGVNIGGATASSFTITGVTANDAANYTVVATNSFGATTSNIVALTVIVPPSDAIVTITVE